MKSATYSHAKENERIKRQQDEACLLEYLAEKIYGLFDTIVGTGREAEGGKSGGGIVVCLQYSSIELEPKASLPFAQVPLCLWQCSLVHRDLEWVRSYFKKIIDEKQERSHRL